MIVRMVPKMIQPNKRMASVSMAVAPGWKVQIKSSKRSAISQPIVGDNCGAKRGWAGGKRKTRYANANANANANAKRDLRDGILQFADLQQRSRSCGHTTVRTAKLVSLLARR